MAKSTKKRTQLQRIKVLELKCARLGRESHFLLLRGDRIEELAEDVRNVEIKAAAYVQNNIAASVEAAAAKAIEQYSAVFDERIGRAVLEIDGAVAMLEKPTRNAFMLWLKSYVY